MRLGFLGCGNMGGAILASLLESEYFTDEILVGERNEKRRAILTKQYSVPTTGILADLSTCDVVVLGIKPQGLQELVFEPREGTILVSILAGTSISSLREKFPMARIVRTMPNLGQSVGKGMTGIFFDPDSGFERTEQKFVEELFLSGGKVLILDSEEKMDEICAISGSGSAYFFHFAECLAKAAIEFGFSSEESELLVRQTLVGSGAVVEQFAETSLAEWKKRVMSPGGTTEQAIASFEKSNLDSIVKHAVAAAMKRAKELAASA